MTRLRAVVLAVLIYVLALPGAASAARVWEEIVEPDDPGGDRGFENVLHYTAGRGENNALRVRQARDGRGLVFGDNGGGVEEIAAATDTCRRLTAHKVLCVPGELVSELSVELRDQNDRAAVFSTDADPEPGGNFSMTLNGGSGSDALRRLTPYVRMNGSGGRDRVTALNGGGLHYPISCGPGRDRAIIEGIRGRGRSEARRYRVARNCERIQVLPVGEEE